MESRRSLFSLAIRFLSLQFMRLPHYSINFRTLIYALWIEKHSNKICEDFFALLSFFRISKHLKNINYISYNYYFFCYDILT